jgi:oxygen-independent coproporphyrinogen-3 oxidase
MAGIYFHITFCKQACYYCDFHFSTSLKRKDDLLLAIGKEITIQAPLLKGEKIETIYFGGGTPSILNKEELQTILESTYGQFDVSKDAEITLEANPDDLSLSKLNDLKSIGINRLSIGVQSFREVDLKHMNRAHNADEAMLCIANAKNAGFENLSVDLIYGIPGLEMKDWESNLNTLVNFDVDHISAYALTVEENTAYDHYIKQGIQQAPKEEEALAQFQFMLGFLKDHGFEQYEISNFAKNSNYSKHNSSYWQKKLYLGIGPSAHSYFGNKRQWNVANNAVYIKSISEGNKWFENEILSLTDQYNEYIMTSLRTVWGCNLDKIESSFGARIKSHFLGIIPKYIEQGFVLNNNGIYTLSSQGKFLADGIASELFFLEPTVQ